MSDSFLFVDVPETLQKIIGQADPGSRLFRAYGTTDDMHEWIKAVTEICGRNGNFSPGGVAQYVRVSRAAVHKKIREGKLTAFCFYVVEDKKLLFRKAKVKVLEESGRPNICAVPVVELHSWKAELDKKRQAKERMDVETISKKDGDDSFLDAEKNWQEKLNKK